MCGPPDTIPTKVDRERWHGHFRRYDDVPPNNDGRTRIMLHSGGPGPNRWYWGVQSPKRKSKMTGAERERREELCTALGHHGLSLAHGDGDWWSQWEWLPRYKDWDPLVPDLHDECEAGGGSITDCYVDGLLGIAALAIPAINEVEMAARATPSGSLFALDLAAGVTECELCFTSGKVGFTSHGRCQLLCWTPRSACCRPGHAGCGRPAMASPCMCGRNATKFGDPDYAKEELVAELTAGYVLAANGLPGMKRDHHAAYLDSWLKVLENDPEAFPKAANFGQRAADYLTIAAATPRASPRFVEGRVLADAPFPTRSPESPIGMCGTQLHGLPPRFMVPECRNHLRGILTARRPLDPRTGGNEVKIQESIYGPGDAESDVAVPAPGRDPAAVRGTEEPRFVVPGAAAQHTRGTISHLPGAPVGRGTRIVIVPTVLRPFEHVAQDVIQSKGVRLERAHRSRLRIPVGASDRFPRYPFRVFRIRRSIIPIAIPTLPCLTLTPESGRTRPRPRHVLPLRLRQQPVPLPRLPRQPLHVPLARPPSSR